MANLSGRCARTAVAGPALLALMVIVGIASVFAPAWAQSARAFSTKAAQAILIDAKTGAVLYQKNADDLVAPASMSKLMTLAVVFRALREGKLKLTDTFVTSENAWRSGGAPSGTSAMFAELGEANTVEDLIKGIAIQSGNDACIVIAEGMAGSEAAFAERMTREAREIGLKKSTFGNSTGLPHPKQLMTAREIAYLSLYLIKTYPEYYHYFGTRSFPYQPPGRRKPYAFFNRNPLLALDIGADGLKTGHLAEAGYGLAASTVQEGQRLVAVVHGLQSARDRREEAEKLIAWGYNSFDNYRVFDQDEIVGRARVWGGDAFFVPLKGDGDIKVLLPRGTSAKGLTVEIVYQGPLKAPIAKGDRVADLRVTAGTQTVNSVPLYAAEDVDRGTVVRRGLDSIAVMTLRWLGDTASDLIESVL